MDGHDEHSRPGRQSMDRDGFGFGGRQILPIASVPRQSVGNFRESQQDRCFLAGYGARRCPENLDQFGKLRGLGCDKQSSSSRGRRSLLRYQSRVRPQPLLSALQLTRSHKLFEINPLLPRRDLFADNFYYFI